MCLHCLSAFTAFQPQTDQSTKTDREIVSIAFRHSPRSSLTPTEWIILNAFGLHCLSAFTAFQPQHRQKGVLWLHQGLHCLSAFTAFQPTPSEQGLTALPRVSIAFRHSPRSSREAGGEAAGRKTKSPLPFGIHRVPAHGSCHDPIVGRREVSIAFRHSPRSSQIFFGHIHWLNFKSLHCLSAFTAFQPEENSSTSRCIIGSPLPFGIHRVPAIVRTYSLTPAEQGLHCLSAFTAFQP